MDKPKKLELFVDEDGVVKLKKAQKEKPKPFPWMALLVIAAVVGMVAIANLPPRNATQPIPQQSIR